MIIFWKFLVRAIFWPRQKNNWKFYDSDNMNRLNKIFKHFLEEKRREEKRREEKRREERRSVVGLLSFYFMSFGVWIYRHGSRDFQTFWKTGFGVFFKKFSWLEMAHAWVFGFWGFLVSGFWGFRAICTGFFAFLGLFYECFW